MKNETSKEKLTKQQENIIGKQMLHGILYGRKTIKEYSIEHGLDENYITQILNHGAKRLIQRKDYENQTHNEKLIKNIK